MNAVTVRDKVTGVLIACGPANGMYNPSYDPLTQTRQEEPSYDTLIAQHAAALAAQPNPHQAMLDTLDAASTLAQVKAAVKDLLK